MAGETIKDVVIRCTIKMVDSDGAKVSLKQMKDLAGETDKVKSRSKSIVQIEREKNGLLREANRQEEIREKRILSQLKYEKELLRLKQQGAGLGGEKGTGVKAGSEKAKNLKDPTLEIGGTAIKIGKLFAAAMIIEQVPAALKSAATGDIWDKAAAVGLGLIEGFEGLINSIGSFTSELLSSLGLSKGTADKIFKGLSLSPFSMAIKAAGGSDKIRKSLIDSGIDPGPTIEESKRSNLFKVIEKQSQLEQQRLDIVKKLIPAENEQLKLTKEKLATAQAELGMLSTRDLEGIQAILERQGKVGFGGLGKDELGRLKDLPGLSALLQGKATQEALNGPNAALIAKILAGTGVPKQVAEMQAAQDAKNRDALLKIMSLNILPGLKIDMDPTKVTDQLAEKIAPLLQEAYARQLDVLRDEINRAFEVSNGARNRAGATGRIR